MVLHSGNLEQRLADLFAPKLRSGKVAYEVLRSPAKPLVLETRKEGAAEVECTIPEGHTCIQWHLEEDGRFLFLRGDKNTDGAFLLVRPEGKVEAHIIECKRKVTQEKWGDVLQQMRWTLCKLLALAGALGLVIEDVVLGTAYRFDELSEESSPNPTVGKPVLDDGHEQTLDAHPISKARLLQLAWDDDLVPLEGLAGTLRHTKIPLDETTGRALSPYRF